MEHVLGGHGFHHLPLQIVTGCPGGHGIQIPRGAGVDRQRHFQPGLVQHITMGGQEILVNAALEWLHRWAKQ